MTSGFQSDVCFLKEKKSQLNGTSSLGPYIPRKGRAGLRGQVIAKVTVGDSLLGTGHCTEAGQYPVVKWISPSIIFSHSQ